MTYEQLLHSKTDFGAECGFEPVWMHSQAFEFQQALATWAIRKGRGAIFADCGLGKSLIELIWGENIVRKTNRPVLLLTPLAVGPQMVAEAEKFGIEAIRSLDGSIGNKACIVVANYQRLHKFEREKFAGVICDESSILKNHNGATKAAITEFMRVIPYRLLATATAAPNDYMELGTSSEALGYLGFQDMLSRFFTQRELKETTMRTADGQSKMIAGWGRKQRENYRLKGHAVRDFWRFVVSWARACRKPSDLGFDDGRFNLPKLITNEYVVKARVIREGWLYDAPAVTTQEQKEDLRRTLNERCELAAQKASEHNGASVLWCHLNDESRLLAKLTPNCVEVSGSTDDKSEEANEEKLAAFTRGEVANLVTKPIIGGFGLNWQHCNHQVNFPSHSFEQYYQCVRRSYRFGQTRDVTVDIITTEGQRGVKENMQRKAAQAEEMFAQLVDLMNDQLGVSNKREFIVPEVFPPWL